LLLQAVFPENMDLPFILFQVEYALFKLLTNSQPNQSEFYFAENMIYVNKF